MALNIGLLQALQLLAKWKCGGARTIYLQWRKVGGELFRVTVTAKNQEDDEEEEGRVHQKDNVDVTGVLYILNH